MKAGVFFAGLSVAVSMVAEGQKLLPCGEAEMYSKALREHPELVQTRNQLEQFTQEYVQNQTSSRTSSQTVYVIPLVFHIIHNYGPENISDAQIYNEMVQLNKDYRKLNSDTSLIISQFKTIAADCHIEFRLAQIDPNGKCTNGIDRIPSLLTYNAGDNSKLNQWSPSKYLNIWVVATLSGDLAGYAYLPGAMPKSADDGVVILSTYIGNIGTGNPETSRALTHEIGHCLNLYHPWGPTNSPGVSCAGSDNVNDTPDTQGFNFCPSTLSQAEVCNPPTVENYQNYMEYSYCSEMFTAGQAARMQATLNSGVASRSSLWQPSNLIATGVNIDTTVNNLCTADFSASRLVFCEGGNTTFTDNSWNGTPTSWNWSFPGGSPSTGTTSQVEVMYPAAGTYDVSLTVSNGTSSPAITKSGFITVFATTAEHVAPFTEGFESGPVPNNNWTVNNVTSDNKYTWTTTNTVGYSSSSSVFINNFDSDSSSYSQLISPTIDLTTISNPKLYYRVAYAQSNASSTDKLSVFVSSNCGANWGAARQSKSGSVLSTVSPQVESSAFTPNSASQWRLDSVPLTLYASDKNVRIMFQFTNGSGNNIYLDDINISSSNNITGMNDLVESALDFTIYPNPSENKSTVNFSLVNSAKVSVQVFNVLGKDVADLVESQNLVSGNYKYAFNASELNSGVYFVKLLIDDQLFVKKVVVK